MTETAKPKIISWSFSRLQDFEKCKLSYKIKHLDKVPEPDRVLRPGQKEFANDRGTRVHQASEDFVRGIGPMIPEMKKFEAEFNHLRHLFIAGKVIMEEDWAHDVDWEITDWKSGWLRMKVDVMVHASETEAVVIDLKTGKLWGNEVKHAQQTQLYSLAAFLRYPKLEVVHTELFYLDVDAITSQTFSRDQALRFKRSFDMRGHSVTDCTDWPANPNRWSCQWCPYGPVGTGHCTVGVRK